MSSFAPQRRYDHIYGKLPKSPWLRLQRLILFFCTQIRYIQCHLARITRGSRSKRQCSEWRRFRTRPTTFQRFPPSMRRTAIGFPLSKSCRVTWTWVSGRKGSKGEKQFLPPRKCLASIGRSISPCRIGRLCDNLPPPRTCFCWGWFWDKGRKGLFCCFVVWLESFVFLVGY